MNLMDLLRSLGLHDGGGSYGAEAGGVKGAGSLAGNALSSATEPMGLAAPPPAETGPMPGSLVGHIGLSGSGWSPTGVGQPVYAPPAPVSSADVRTLTPMQPPVLERSVVRQKEQAGVDERPPGMSWADRLQMIGSTLQDIGAIGRGGEGGHFDKTVAGMKAESLASAQLAARQRVAASGVLGRDPAFLAAYVQGGDDPFSKALADRLAPHDISRGGEYYIPGQGSLHNDSLTRYGGTLYNDRTGDTVGSPLPPSADDLAAPVNAAAHAREADAAAKNADTARIVGSRGDWTLDGVDAQGMPIYHNRYSRGDTYTGDTPINGRPGAESVFQQRVAAMRAAGMNEQDVAEFASGRRSMTPQQIEQAAERAATQRVFTEAPADAATAHEQYKREAIAALTAAAPTPSAAAAPSAWPQPPAAAIQYLQQDRAQRGAAADNDFNARFGPGASRYYAPAH